MLVGKTLYIMLTSFRSNTSLNNVEDKHVEKINIVARSKLELEYTVHSETMFNQL